LDFFPFTIFFSLENWFFFFWENNVFTYNMVISVKDAKVLSSAVAFYLFIYGWQKISFFRPEKYDFDAYKGLFWNLRQIPQLFTRFWKGKFWIARFSTTGFQQVAKNIKKKFLAHLVYSQIWLNPLVYNHRFGNFTKLKGSEPTQHTHTPTTADIKHLRRALLEMQLTITISLESCNGPKGLPMSLTFSVCSKLLWLCTGTHTGFIMLAFSLLQFIKPRSLPRLMREVT